MKYTMKSLVITIIIATLLMGPLYLIAFDKFANWLHPYVAKLINKN